MLDHATIAIWISRYSYAAIFCLLVGGIVGLPIPDRLVLLIAGYGVLTHVLSLSPTLAVTVVGSICGITLSYGIGRGLGVYLSARPFGKKRLEHGKKLFDRFGNRALILGFFIPGVRNLIGIVPGMMRISIVRFAGFAYPGVLMSSITAVAAGFVFGAQAMWLLRSLDRMLIACLLAFAGYLAFRCFTSRRLIYSRDSR